MNQRLTSSLSAHVFNVLLVCVVIMLALIAGIVAGKGKVTYLAPLLILISIPIVARMGIRARYKMLLAIPFINLFQIPSLHLPLGFPPVIVFMCVLTLAHGVSLWQYRQLTMAGLKEYLPFAVLSIGGLITGFKNNELANWYIFPLMPLLWLFLCKNLSVDPKGVQKSLMAIFTSILGYLLLIWFLKTFGQTRLVTYNAASSGWRLFGEGTELSFGPLIYTLYSIEIGTITGIGFLIAIFFLLQKDIQISWRFIFISSLILFLIILGLAAARGATVSLIIGSLLIIFIVRWGEIRMFTFLLLIGAFVIGLQKVYSYWIPSETVARFQVMFNDLAYVDEFQYRLRVLTTTFQLIKEQPLGLGYNYLRITYGLDESIVYSSIMNGTGVIGSIGYLLLIFQFLTRFISQLINRTFSHRVNYAALGLALWFFGTLNGFSSTSIVKDPVIVFTFWAAIITVFVQVNSAEHKSVSVYRIASNGIS